jgi:hypothetical protein
MQLFILYLISVALASLIMLKVVGTSYKQESRQLAIKTELDYFGQSCARMVETVEESLVATRQILFIVGGGNA